MTIRSIPSQIIDRQINKELQNNFFFTALKSMASNVSILFQVSVFKPYYHKALESPVKAVSTWQRPPKLDINLPLSLIEQKAHIAKVRGENNIISQMSAKEIGSLPAEHFFQLPSGTKSGTLFDGLDGDDHVFTGYFT